MEQLSLLHADEVTCNPKQNKKQGNGSLFVLTSNLRDWAKEKPLFTQADLVKWENPYELHEGTYRSRGDCF